MLDLQSKTTPSWRATGSSSNRKEVQCHVTLGLVLISEGLYVCSQSAKYQSHKYDGFSYQKKNVLNKKPLKDVKQLVSDCLSNSKVYKFQSHAASRAGVSKQIQSTEDRLNEVETNCVQRPTS